MEDAAAEIVHVEAGAFAVLELQRDDVCSGVHTFDQAEGYCIPQLATDHVDAVKTQLGHLEELPEVHAAQPAMAVPIDAAAAAEKALYEVAEVRPTRER